MKTVFQSVIKKVSEVTLKVSKNIGMQVAAIIMTKGRKNYTSMAHENNISYNDLIVKKDSVESDIFSCSQFLIDQIKVCAAVTNIANCYLIIDFTMLQKAFSQRIPGVTYDYDGVTKNTAKGFSAGFVFWSDGNIVIPFDFELWLRKKDSDIFYKKKTQIAQEIILAVKNKGIPFNEVRLDGAFSSAEMLHFFFNNNIHFTMRIPCNRVIETEDGKYQLENHPSLALKKNQKYKTVYASFKGLLCYFTVQKRKGKNGKHETVFIVSDLKRSPKEHVKKYKQRWPSEKFFRTGKQHIGLRDCQSINAKKQKLHIFHCMVAYVVLQLIKIDKKKISVEQILHPMRDKKLYDTLSQYIDLDATLMN